MNSGMNTKTLTVKESLKIRQSYGKDYSVLFFTAESGIERNNVKVLCPFCFFLPFCGEIKLCKREEKVGKVKIGKERAPRKGKRAC